MMRCLLKITLCCLFIPACTDGLTNDDQSTGTVPVGKVARKVGVRNFQEINLTMSALTGIDHQEESIKKVYDSVSSMLPLDNSAQGFHAPVQVAIFRLASVYCHQLIIVGRGRDKLFPDINFDAAAKVALAPDKRNDVASAFVTVLWERSASVPLPASESIASISQYISEAIDELNSAEADSKKQTKEVLFSVCNAMLASAPVTFH